MPPPSRPTPAKLPPMTDTEHRATQDPWKLARDQLAKAYEADHVICGYQAVMTQVANDCKETVEALRKEQGDSLFPYQEPTCRLKTAASLAKKLLKITPACRSESGSSLSVYEATEILYDKIRDFAGVRVLVYFPAHANAIFDAIRKSDRFKIVFKGVHFSSKRIDQRGDLASERMNTLQLPDSDGSYMIGAFVEGSDDVITSYQNSGYRANHLTVQSNFVPPAKVRSSSRPARWEFPERSACRVEIQITTVLMHAWAQVEHDIIYKNTHRLPITPTIVRMLDCINGLAINSELLLEELQRALEINRAEIAERQTQPFEDDEASRIYFRATIRHAYEDNDIENYELSPGHLDALYFLVSSSATGDRGPEPDAASPVSSPSELYQYISSLAKSPSSELRLTRSKELCIVQSLSADYKSRLDEHIRTRASVHGGLSPTVLLKILLLLNTVSLYSMLTRATDHGEMLGELFPRQNRERVVNTIDRAIQTVVKMRAARQVIEPVDLQFLELLADDLSDGRIAMDQQLALATALSQMLIFRRASPKQLKVDTKNVPFGQMIDPSKPMTTEPAELPSIKLDLLSIKSAAALEEDNRAGSISFSTMSKYSMAQQSKSTSRLSIQVDSQSSTSPPRPSASTIHARKRSRLDTTRLHLATSADPNTYLDATSFVEKSSLCTADNLYRVSTATVVTFMQRWLRRYQPPPRVQSPRRVAKRPRAPT